MGVRPDIEAALLSALERLVDGKAIRSPPGVTMANVALEAGVGRATAYRCDTLVVLVRSHAKGAPSEPAVSRSSGERQSTERELRTALRQMMNRIVYLEGALGERDRLIAAQREQLLRLRG